MAMIIDSHGFRGTSDQALGLLFGSRGLVQCESEDHGGVSGCDLYPVVVDGVRMRLSLRVGFEDQVLQDNTPSEYHTLYRLEDIDNFPEYEVEADGFAALTLHGLGWRSSGF